MEIGLLSLDKIYWIRVEFGLETAACTQRRASSSDPTGFSFFFVSQFVNVTNALTVLRVSEFCTLLDPTNSYCQGSVLCALYSH